MGSNARIIKFEDIVRARQKDTSVYRVRLDFRFANLICTRDLAVPSGITLHDLHAIIQACGSWMNYHLYNFEFVFKGRIMRAEPRWQTEELESFNSRIPVVESEMILLSDAFSEFPSVLYRYDYGDGWEINILMLDELYDDEIPSKTPCCIAGKGDWPPEDVGGEGGFVRLLDILKGPHDEEHAYMSEWADDRGFERYSRAKCNRNLSEWKEFTRTQ